MVATAKGAAAREEDVREAVKVGVEMVVVVVATAMAVAAMAMEVMESQERRSDS